MIIGFTGSRHGMTPEQEREVVKLLVSRPPQTFHHGGCIGADTQFHVLARKIAPQAIAIIHPCNLPAAYHGKFDIDIGDAVLPAKPPLQRNGDIVNACQLLIATPATPKEELRSGTWATIRYAKKQSKPYVIIYPTGNSE